MAVLDRNRNRQTITREFCAYVGTYAASDRVSRMMIETRLEEDRSRLFVERENEKLVRWNGPVTRIWKVE